MCTGALLHAERLSFRGRHAMLPAVCVLVQGQPHLAGQVELVRHVQAARQTVLTMRAWLRLAVQDQRLAVVLEIVRQYLPGSAIVPAIGWAVIMYADLEKSTMPAANAAAMALNAPLVADQRLAVVLEIVRQYLPGSAIVPAIRWAVIMYADLEKSTMPAANAAAMALNARLTVGARRIILTPAIVAVKLRMALNIGKNP